MQRKGATLVEVLVAIFVMGIGLMSLLVLFPLGALTMAEAIQNDRAATLAANAAAIGRFKQVRTDFDPNVGTGTGETVDTIYDGLPIDTVAGQPGNTVYVDPIGYYLNGGSGDAAKRVGTTQIQRRRVKYATNQNEALRRFSLLDDLTFAANGTPAQTGGGNTNIEREGRYTWAFMCRRKKAQDPTSECDLSVVVYYQRLMQSGEATTANGVATSRAAGEPTYQAAFDSSTPRVVFTRPASLANPPDSTAPWPPPVKKGSYILDGSDPRKDHGLFYRVLKVGDNDGDTMWVELQNKPRVGIGSGRAVVMENVIDVFERGTK